MAGLQFSDTSASRNGLLQDCEDNLNLGVTGITSNTNLLSTFTRYINTWYHKVVTMILEAQDDWDFDDLNNTDYPVATTPLVANQRDYTFPASLKILKIKRVDISYDSTNWFRANPLDSAAFNVGLGSDANTDANFTQNNPFYDPRANSVWIYPRATSSVGSLRIEFYRDIAEFITSDTTKTPGIDTPFHRMLALGASLDYALIRDLKVAPNLKALLDDYEIRLKQYYGKKDDDMVWILRNPYVSNDSANIGFPPNPVTRFS